MRIALTALTPQGPADVIVSGDDGATAGQVAEALHEAFAPQEHLAPVIMHPRAAQAQGARLAVPRPVLWVGGQQIPPDTPAGRALREVAREMGVSESVLDEALDLRRMALGGS